MESRYEYIRNVIKSNVLMNQDPYLKNFIIPHEGMNNAKEVLDVVERACDSLIDELGFRFKVTFKQECCILKARKIPIKDAFMTLCKKHNYARLNR